jgi:hypothetical protein
MKSLVLAMLALLLPVTVHAAASLTCSGEYIWVGENLSDKFTLSATVIDSSILSRVQEFRDEEGDTAEFSYLFLTADQNYKPAAFRYRGYNRFPLNHAAIGWTRYYLLLPKDLGAKSPFTAYIQRVGHDTYPTVDLTCEIKSL